MALLDPAHRAGLAERSRSSALRETLRAVVTKALSIGAEGQ